jgi:hypothetical protein
MAGLQGGREGAEPAEAPQSQCSVGPLLGPKVINPTEIHWFPYENPLISFPIRS